jgi:serine/threonine protein kinase
VSAEPQTLDALCESVADGRRIDWLALEMTHDDDAQRRLCLDLSIVAAVADAFGADDDEMDEGGSNAELHPPAASLTRWGRLLLRDRIGEGHYAEVYRGHDVWLDTDVAVKLLKPQSDENLPALRLRDEARALARVRHENVVRVLGADIHEGRAGLWMELVPGRTLDQRLREEGALGAPEAGHIARQLCAALGAVHDAGIVHGDLKAQNVMQEAGGRFDDAWLGDAAPTGTPLYLAPEVLNGGETTIASDIYALGVLLYRLVTGTYPVTASSLEGLMAPRMRRANAVRFVRRGRTCRPVSRRSSTVRSKGIRQTVSRAREQWTRICARSRSRTGDSRLRPKAFGSICSRLSGSHCVSYRRVQYTEAGR